MRTPSKWTWTVVTRSLCTKRVLLPRAILISHSLMLVSPWMGGHQQWQYCLSLNPHHSQHSPTLIQWGWTVGWSYSNIWVACGHLGSPGIGPASHPRGQSIRTAYAVPSCPPPNPSAYRGHLPYHKGLRPIQDTGSHWTRQCLKYWACAISWSAYVCHHVHPIRKRFDAANITKEQ